jgi:hypothetical protein
MSKSTSLTISQPDESIKTNAASALAAVAVITVTSMESSLFAQGFRASIAKQIDELTEQRLKITRPIDAAKKGIMSLFAGPIDTLTQAKRLLDGRILEWDDAQRREQARLQREAEEAARVERTKLLTIANAGRATAPAIAAVAEQAARAVVAAPVAAFVPVRVPGVSLPTHYTFEIVDVSQIKPEFMTPNLVEIGKLVRSMHEDAEKLVGGIRVKAERSVRS